MTNREKADSFIRILKKLIARPKSIFLVLKDESEYEDHLKKKYGKTHFPTVDINYFIHGREEVNHYTFLEGGSWITDLALLKSIGAKYKNPDYLEIGSWRGESIANIADLEGSKCTSINLSPEQIIAMGLPEKYANEHGCLIKNRRNIKTVYADSLKFDFSELNQKFDLIFVDGDHSYNAVKSDTANVFKLLKNDKSCIVWHDYGFDPVTPRHSVISAILDGLPAEEHKHLYHVSNTLCALYTKDENISGFIESNVHSADKVFRVSIESEKL